jgi:antitoxin VapB
MNTAKIFKNGRSQAIRLPKEYRLNGKEAYINKLGEAIIILPVKEKWQSLLESLEHFSDDIFDSREQPELEDREETFR